MCAFEAQRVTCDVVVFRFNGNKLEMLLVKRGKKNDPFKGYWAIPGGFAENDETLDQTALRELREETNLKGVKIEQFYTFGDPGRDPRGRTVTAVYFTIITTQKVRAGSDAGDAKWFDVCKIPKLAFDHNKVAQKALITLLEKSNILDKALQIFPKEITLGQLGNAITALQKAVSGKNDK